MRACLSMRVRVMPKKQIFLQPVQMWATSDICGNDLRWDCYLSLTAIKAPAPRVSHMQALKSQHHDLVNITADWTVKPRLFY